MEQRDFKGVWIPKEIWELDIPINDKYYLSIYKEFEDFNIADSIMKYTVSERSILKIKNRLREKGLINFIDTPERAKQTVIQLAQLNQGKTCEWCGRKNYVLHEHHYPISKSHGGTTIVNICPNCHANYHRLYKGEN